MLETDPGLGWIEELPVAKTRIRTENDRHDLKQHKHDAGGRDEKKHEALLLAEPRLRIRLVWRRTGGPTVGGSGMRLRHRRSPGYCATAASCTALAPSLRTAGMSSRFPVSALIAASE